ncbi:E3 ubiquitin-protein ligase SIAH1B-like, partial [Centruroides vittatus]|uniref:E3 ubiquitin-protein ligase SIAH1B-like n=1 Tax=Centruroides vittatus TaxID=120091 RepID=UPI00350F1E9E
MDTLGQEDAVTSLVTCPICYNLAQPLVFQCSNGHIVCSSCQTRIEHCHTCREPLGHIRSLVVEQLASSLLFTCPYKTHGCPFQTPLHQREEHQKACQFKAVTCPFPESSCSWDGDRTTLFTHLQQRHPLARLYSRSTLLFMGIALWPTRTNNVNPEDAGAADYKPPSPILPPTARAEERPIRLPSDDPSYDYCHYFRRR